MPDTPDDLPLADTLPAGREEEALFARDENDILVRREKETRERFDDLVTVVIDGHEVTVPRAVPKTDAQGNRLRGADGELIPRTTTIHDAAATLVAAGTWTDEELRARIPVLCHQRHVTPVGVCRMCSVHVSVMKRGKVTPGRKLVPACQHRVERDMVVTTRRGAEGHARGRDSEEAKAVARFAADVNDAVRLLAEFLLADHHRPPAGTAKRYDDELGAVGAALGVWEARDRLKPDPGLPTRNAPDFVPNARRFALPVADGAGHDPGTWDGWNAAVDAGCPYSSRTVVVDHDRCILCDRCVRACTEVKPFKVIGHTGKGYGTRISFDLDAPMGESSCVQCGECMTSCPTGALSVRRRVQPRAWEDSPDRIPVNPHAPFPAGSGFLTAAEVRDVWLWYDSPARGRRVVFPFRGVPYSYLKWNEGAVRRWEVPPGSQRVLCREGEYGNTAFLLQGTGEFEIRARGGGPARRPGFLARLLGRPAAGTPPPGTEPLVRVARGDELVLGEMACLTQRPRAATVVAVAPPDNPALALGYDRNGRPTVAAGGSGPVVVYEVTRNLLDMMQRSASARDDVQEMYTFRAIQTCVAAGRLFAGLGPEDRERAATFLLTAGVEFRRVEAGETIVAEGDPAAAFYIVRLGTVRVFTAAGGRERVLRLLSAGDYFGEAALLADRPGARSASAAALDPVELVRVPGPVFRRLCETFPALREGFAAAPRPAVAGVTGTPPPGVLGEYVRQGLFQGQKLLALDLLSCTRCDECTRACADSHDGNARLLREGLRFGDFLVATSCRSCHTPYCMDGCPVDAIHRRGGHLEVVIEDHCIGCGLCERNCPYGSIHMVPRGVPNPAAAGVPGGNPALTAARRAVNCDLCNGGEPFCVEACPHEAAFRKTGPELLDEVLNRLTRGGG
jgi:Fe-S-cluster-containing hydrogenase component 2/CRP-like cAMP-binding protein